MRREGQEMLQVIKEMNKLLPLQNIHLQTEDSQDIQVLSLDQPNLQKRERFNENHWNYSRSLKTSFSGQTENGQRKIKYAPYLLSKRKFFLYS